MTLTELVMKILTETKTPMSAEEIWNYVDKPIFDGEFVLME